MNAAPSTHKPKKVERSEICLRPGCGVPLTGRQIGRNKYHSRRCAVIHHRETNGFVINHRNFALYALATAKRELKWR